MKILREIPFRLDESAFLNAARLESFPEGKPAVRSLLATALPRVRPKAMYTISYIGERSDSSVQIDGIRFSSRLLSRNLQAVERVFPYVATCGNELEELETSCGDPLARFWLDTLKEMALTAAVEHLRKHLKIEYGITDISSMNPGSGNTGTWPLAQQRPLFELLGDVEAAIGVRLTPSFLMLPNKSVSGILFPTEVHFETCQLCTREGCPRRRAPFLEQPVETPAGSHF